MYALFYALGTPLRYARGGASYALFDMIDDPDEKRDLYKSKPDVVKELMPWLAALDAQRQVGASERKGDDEDAEAKIEAHLRALGYVED